MHRATPTLSRPSTAANPPRPSAAARPAYTTSTSHHVIDPETGDTNFKMNMMKLYPQALTGPHHAAGPLHPAGPADGPGAPAPGAEAAPVAQSQLPFFPETGFRLANPQFADFFTKRGGPAHLRLPSITGVPLPRHPRAVLPAPDHADPAGRQRGDAEHPGRRLDAVHPHQRLRLPRHQSRRDRGRPGPGLPGLRQPGHLLRRGERPWTPGTASRSTSTRRSITRCATRRPSRTAPRLPP